MNVRFKKIWKRIFIVAVVIFIGMQFANPSLKNPPVQPGHDLMATNPPPPEVATLLRQACYDCHSNETKWPWYAHVAPVSFWIVDHMREGREGLNFSEWPHADAYVASEQLGRIGDKVQSRKMPLPSYTWLGMHPEARLTDEERGRILKWTEQAAQRLEADAGK
jgi:uncharacterized membrane protein